MTQFQLKIINLLAKTEGVIVAIRKDKVWLSRDVIDATNDKCWSYIRNSNS